MNCVSRFEENCRRYPNRPALWIKGVSVTFAELQSIVGKAQGFCRELGISKGDTILLVDTVGIRLYAFVIAALGLGANIIFVEPWMESKKISSVIDSIKPSYFLSNYLGVLWSFRSSAVRAIKNKVDISRFADYPPSNMEVVSVSPDSDAITTFSSGTTGTPKGTPRRHGYLLSQLEVLNKVLKIDQQPGMDLCVFPNFVLLNLAAGRGAIAVSPGWKSSELKQISALRGNMAPTTVTCGPAFLLKLIRLHASFSSLKECHIGGALTDWWIFDEAFKKWPDALWIHLYGSSEVEPVAICDAKEAVLKSKARGHFQTLYLGKPVGDIEYKNEDDSVWVSGIHVAPMYLNNEEENKKNKRVDEDGKIWHRMGDRILIDSEGWWYQGRSHQLKEDFILEQKVYSLAKSSKFFITRDEIKNRYLWGEGLSKLPMGQLGDSFYATKKTKIKRDARHKSRIDRIKSMRRPYWNTLGIG